MTLSERIKTLRAQHGFSQEELARQTQLSLRTIQRIEQNETEARGDTLKRLAEVFELKPVDLINRTEKEETISIHLLNLSALSFIVYPLLGFLVPLILWYIKRNDDKQLDHVGRKLINFQMTWTLLATAIFVVVKVLKLMHIGGLYNIYALFVLQYVFYPLNVALIIINALRIRNEKAVIYKPAIPFFKV